MLAVLAVSQPMSPLARASTEVSSGIRDVRGLHTDESGRIWEDGERGRSLVGHAPPGNAPADDGVATSPAVDADRDRIVDTLETELRRRPDDRADVLVVRKRGAGESVEPRSLNAAEAADLARRDDVLSLWPDMQVRVSPPRAASGLSGMQWTTVQPEDAVRSLAQVRTIAGTTGEGIDVAVIDSGVDARHASLAGRVAHREEFVTTEAGCTGDGPGVGDAMGHGTHVAGIIAGTGSVRGVAPGARIVSLRALTCNGSGSNSDIIAAIEWLIAHHDDPVLGLNVRVANLSLGAFACGWTFDGTDPLSVAVNRLVAAGVATYVAAGNSALDGCRAASVGTPGAARFATTVGASVPETVAGSTLAIFSSRGLLNQDRIKPDLVAPGVNIRSAAAALTDLDPSSRPSDWVAMSGTSMATPFAAGVAALALAREPELAPAGEACSIDICPDGVVPESMSSPLLDRERATAKDRGPAGPDHSWGWGLLRPDGVLGAGPATHGTTAAVAAETGEYSTAITVRFEVTHEAPVGFDVIPIVPARTRNEVARENSAHFAAAVLERVADGRAVDIWPGYYYSGGYLWHSTSARGWHTGTGALSPGWYDLTVPTNGFAGTVVIDISNASSAVATDTLIGVATDGHAARPGGPPVQMTLTNNLSEAATVSVRDVTGTAVVVPASVTLGAGHTGVVSVSVPAGSTRSGISLTTRVTGAQSAGNVGLTTPPLVLAVRPDTGRTELGDLPAIERVTQNEDGTGRQPHRAWFSPGESAETSTDGRFVAFWAASVVSTDDGLVPSPSVPHVYVRDRLQGTTKLVGGEAARSQTAYVFDVHDSRVLLATRAALLPSDTNGCWDLYTWDALGGSTVRVSPPRQEGSSCASFPGMMASVSPDGHRVAWMSPDRFTPEASDWLVTSDGNVYVTDLRGPTTVLVNEPDQGVRNGWGTGIRYARIRWTSDSRRIVFVNMDADVLPLVERKRLVTVDVETGERAAALPQAADFHMDVYSGFTLVGDRLVVGGYSEGSGRLSRLWTSPLSTPEQGSFVDLPVGSYADFHGNGPNATILVTIQHAFGAGTGWCGLVDPVTGSSAPLRDEDSGILLAGDCSGTYISEGEGEHLTVTTARRLTGNDGDLGVDSFVLRPLSPLASLHLDDLSVTTTAGTPITADLVHTGGVGAVRFGFENGSTQSYLGTTTPAWLTLDPATGTLSGTAPHSLGTFTVTVVAVDSELRRSQARVVVTVVAPPGVPGAFVAHPGPGRVRLEWQAPASDGGAPVSAYVLHYRTDTGAWTTVPADVAADGRTHTVTDLENGVRHWFRVAAVNAAGRGAWSDALAATPITTAGAPPGLSASPLDGGVVLTWAAPLTSGGATVTSYVLERSLDGATWTPSGSTTGALPRSHTVTGLDNGVKHWFRVAAVTAAGTGAFSEPVTATPATTASWPLGFTVGAGDGVATLRWETPTTDGGAPITSYVVEHSLDWTNWTRITASASAVTRTLTVTGLDNGVRHWFRVAAVTAAGTGAYSALRDATPSGLPGVPRAFSAQRASGAVVLSWSGPLNDGGRQILSYTVEMSPDGLTWVSVDTDAASPYTVSGLMDGIPMLFRVSARNSNGAGTWSSVVAATPSSPASAPTELRVRSGSASAHLSWAAPLSDGGAAVTSYVVQRSTDGMSWTVLPAIVGPDARSHTVTGLVNGTRYWFRTVAVTAAGHGVPTAGVSVVPAGPPLAPTSVRATAGTGSVTVAWAPPTSSNGSPVTSYRLERSLDGRRWSVVGTVSASTRTLVVRNLARRTVHWFRLSAVTSAGTGPGTVVSTRTR